MTLKEACAETRKFGRMLKGVERLIDVAAALESAEQAVGDRRREEAQALAAVAARQAELDELARKLICVRDTAAQTEHQAKEQAASIVAAARDEASNFLRAARNAEKLALERQQVATLAANAAEARAKEAANELTATTERIASVKAEALKTLTG